MPNIASILKQEIARIARKELRVETTRLRKATSAYRSEIAAMKRRIEALEKQAKRSAQRSTPPAGTHELEQLESRHRFSSKGLAKHRQRLGLSASDYGRLLGVSQLSVYKWEGGQARPRAKYLPVIAEVRTLGKREAAKRLDALAR